NLRAWSLILYKDAEFIAKENKHALIRPEDMEAAVLHLEPHIINDHEDAVFFPKLNDSLKIKIEAYDMDAYRDFGFHWMAYQKMVLPYLKNNKDSLFADPFASEIFVEAIAQYGVLVWRMTGMLATERSVKEKDNEPVVLRRAHLRKAVSAINSLADLNAKATVEEHVETRILSAPNVQAPDAQTLLEVDANSGIDFTYHLAAWRKSWVMDTYGEKIFKAFHGTGIGVADINEDGIEDVLMLSGDGYKLYQGNGNGTFTDITKKSGIELPDTHNNIGEPFQPLLADFDNDGKTDIIITFSYNNHLVFRNKGNGTFENLTQKVNIGSKSDPSVAAVTADFDNDGLLDLYVTNFGDTVGGLKP
ncbi:MAG: VCBS repeat-containing protein, partial [Candidatus Omnitrophica bacterium]|nr:VCBS repeat-containing protein [Candidatus Omnitrophota bacterium]